MIDHTAVNVTDYEAAKAFYSQALEPLGYSLAFEAGDFMGFADANGMDLGVVRREPERRSARRVQVRRPRDGGRLLRGCDRGGRQGQRRARPPHALPRALLRGLRPRRRREQHRGRLPGASMTVAHVAVNVSDWERAKGFYEAVLGPLGYRVVYEEDGALAYFADRQGLDFGLGRRDPVGGAHVAFDCPDRETVDALLRERARRRRPRQRASRDPRAVRRELLRGVRPRRRRQQHRGGLSPRAELSAATTSGRRRSTSSVSRLPARAWVATLRSPPASRRSRSRPAPA